MDTNHMNEAETADGSNSRSVHKTMRRITAMRMVFIDKTLRAVDELELCLSAATFFGVASF